MTTQLFNHHLSTLPQQPASKRSADYFLTMVLALMITTAGLLKKLLSRVVTEK
jgi:hypothetical protein